MSGEKDNKKQIIILGVLGVVLVAVLGNAVLGGKKPSAQAKQTGAKTAAKSTTAATDGTVESVFQKVDVDLDQLVQEIKVVEFQYELEREDRDPTLPLVGDSMLLRARTAMAGVNQRLGERGATDLEMGIGIHTGSVIVGNIGSARRTKYAAVGANVNLAGRIESFTTGQFPPGNIRAVVHSLAPAYFATPAQPTMDEHVTAVVKTQVRRAVTAPRADPLLATSQVTGALYDLRTGVVSPLA